MTNQQPPPDAFSIDCARAQDILFDLQEAQMEAGSGIIVTVEDQSRLERHLADCAHCRSYRQTMTNLAQSFTQLEPVPVPAGLEDRIIAKISLEASFSKNAIPSGFQWKKYMPIAAAVLVLAVAIPLVMKSVTGGSNTPQVAQYSQDDPDNPELQPADLNELANLPDQIQPINPPEHPMQEAMYAQPPGGPEHESISGPMPMNNQPRQEQNNRYASSPDDQEPSQRGGDGNYAVDASSLASALPPAATGQLNETGDDEGDVYYDPVSNLVGF